MFKNLPKLNDAAAVLLATVAAVDDQMGALTNQIVAATSQFGAATSGSPKSTPTPEPKADPAAGSGSDGDEASGPGSDGDQAGEAGDPPNDPPLTEATAQLTQ